MCRSERVVVANTVVAEYEDGAVVLTFRTGNHRRRRYVFTRDRLTVTIGDVTEEIPLPWAEKD
jgi:hypothetical protein